VVRPLRILFLTPRLPGRGPRGDQLRAYQQIRLLSRRHRLTLVSFDAEAGPADRVDALAKLCDRIAVVPHPRAAMWASLARGALSSLPLQVALYRTEAMRRAVADALAREPFDVVHAQLVRMAPYLPAVGPPARVIDLVDALSVNMARRSRHDRGPAGWVARLEAARLARFERRVVQSVDRAIVCAAGDRDAIGPFPTLATVGNGVDPAEYAFERSGRDPTAIVFSGNMGYFPNVHAARWFADRVLPRIRRALPGATFHVVGARPHRTLRRLARRDPAVVVTGFVEPLPPHLRRAAIAVAPIHAGSGQALKVLEAMATGTPVVATPLAAAGIGARPDEHLLVAEDPESFAAEVVRLLRDPDLADRLAASARHFVEAQCTWEHSVAALEAVYRAVADPPRGAGETAGLP
jgi:sugar transferase (PEP-CTERM/EpsH1 system associated)